jgi:hypothetical protein
MHRLMSLLAISAFFLAVMNARAQNISDDMFIGLILDSNHIQDLGDKSHSEKEWVNFVLGAGPRLFSLVLTYPDKDKVWKAIHHFRSMTDAGFTTSFQMDCFDALKKNPFIFYDRYMAGDNLALDRMLDATEAYLIDERDICEKEKVNRKFLEMGMRKLEKMKANFVGNQEIKRHSIFVKEVNNKLIWRKKTFKELFPDRCK